MNDTSPHDPEDVSFGRAAMARGLVTADRIREALAEQARVGSSGEKLPLWAVLVRMGHLSPKDVSELQRPGGSSGSHAALGTAGPTSSRPPLPGTTATGTPSGRHPAPGTERTPTGSHPSVDSRRTPTGNHPSVDSRRTPTGNHPSVGSTPAPTSRPPGLGTTAPSSGHHKVLGATAASSGRLRAVPPSSAATPSPGLGRTAAAPLTPTPGPAGGGVLQPLLVAGSLLGDWRLVAELGRGGMGVVFKARREGTEELAALKVLRDPGRASLVERFVRETRAVERLDHPHIVRLIDSGKAGDLPYYVMELVEGRGLDAVLAADGKLEGTRAATILRDVASAAHAAHEAGIVHRDFKPANVLVTAAFEPKVMDFGLAKLEDEGNKLTRTGAAVGTPTYMSPEQVQGRSIDRRTDVWALGVMLHELVVGHPPWGGSTPSEVFYKIVNDEIPPAEIDPTLDRIIRKCCQKTADDRYQTAEELAGDLDTWLGGGTVEAKLPGALTLLGRQLAASRQLLLAAGVGALVVVPVLLFVRGDRRHVETVTVETAPVATAVAPARSSGAAPVSSGDAAGRDRLAAVAEFRRDHPDDRRGAIERYRAISTELPDSDAALLANDEANALETLVEKDESIALDAFLKETRPQQRSDDIGAAVAKLAIALDSPEWSARSKDAIKRAITEIGARTRATISEMEKRGTDLARIGDTKGAQSAIAELQALALPPVLDSERMASIEHVNAMLASARDTQAASQAAAAEKTRAAKAEEEARAILADLGPLESAGDLEGARARIGTACVVPSVVAARQELERAFAGREVLRTVAATHPDLDLGGGVNATIERLDEARLVVILKPRKKGGPVEAPLATVLPKLAHVGSDTDRAAVATYLLLRGSGEAALLAALGAGEAGKPLLERAQAVAADEHRRTFATALDAAIALALDASKSALDATAKLKALVEKNLADPAVVARHDAIKDAYSKGRARAFHDDPALVFHGGKCKVERGGILSVTYDWKDAVQGRDWVIEGDLPGGALNVDTKKKLAVIAGHVRHVARLTGKIRVHATVAAVDAARPNVNLVLHDQGSFSGLLVGIGWNPKDMTKVTFPKDAMAHAGENVGLPAIAVVVLAAGKKPAEWRIESAESGGDDIAAPGRRVRLDVSKEDAALRVAVNGATVVDLEPAPLRLQLGGVGFAPDSSGLVLHEVQIEGKLEADWLIGFMADQAAAEANALLP